jgi:hypothetical protein
MSTLPALSLITGLNTRGYNLIKRVLLSRVKGVSGDSLTAIFGFTADLKFMILRLGL